MVATNSAAMAAAAAKAAAITAAAAAKAAAEKAAAITAAAAAKAAAMNAAAAAKAAADKAAAENAVAEKAAAAIASAAAADKAAKEKVVAQKAAAADKAVNDNAAKGAVVGNAAAGFFTDVNSKCASKKTALWNNQDGVNSSNKCCRTDAVVTKTINNKMTIWCASLELNDGCIHDEQCKSGYCSLNKTAASVCANKPAAGGGNLVATNSAAMAAEAANAAAITAAAAAKAAAAKAAAAKAAADKAEVEMAFAQNAAIADKAVKDNAAKEKAASEKAAAAAKAAADPSGMYTNAYMNSKPTVNVAKNCFIVFDPITGTGTVNNDGGPRVLTALTIGGNRFRWEGSSITGTFDGNRMNWDNNSTWMGKLPVDSNVVKTAAAFMLKTATEKAAMATVDRCHSNINGGLCNPSMRAGNCSADMQGDGNFVIYSGTPPVAVWSTKTRNHGSPPYRLMLESDGNLVVKDKSGKKIWNSNTGGNHLKFSSPYTAILRDNCNFLIQGRGDTYDKHLWQTFKEW